MDTQALEQDINAVYQAIKSNYDSVTEAWEAATVAVSVLANRWGQTSVLHELTLAEQAN